MSLPGRPARGGPAGGEGNGHVVMSAGRGAILVGVAVVVGLILYAIVDDSRATSPASTPVGTQTPATTPAPTGPSTTPTTAGTTDTTKPKKSTTTTVKPGDTKGARPNEQVVVQVLNGSGVPNAATTRSNDLRAKGYQTVPATNAADRTGTGVQCRAGYEKEANVLVNTLRELGITATVEPLPDPVPAGFDAAANCYVVLGK